MRPNRRQFLGSSLAAGALLASGLAARGETRRAPAPIAGGAGTLGGRCCCS